MNGRSSRVISVQNHSLPAGLTSMTTPLEEMSPQEVGERWRSTSRSGPIRWRIERTSPFAAGERRGRAPAATMLMPGTRYLAASRRWLSVTFTGGTEIIGRSHLRHSPTSRHPAAPEMLSASGRRGRLHSMESTSLPETVALTGATSMKPGPLVRHRKGTIWLAQGCACAGLGLG
jgi:hypothetical protein